MTRARLAPWVCIVVTIAAVASPLLTDADGYPLSSYPMFASPRPRTVEVAHFLGYRPDGTSSPVPPVALGTNEVVGAYEIARAARRDLDDAEAICHSVLRRRSEYAAVALVVETFDTLEYFHDRVALTASEVLRCHRDELR